MSRRKVFLSDHAHLRQKEALDILDSSYKPGRKWRKLGQEVLFDIIEVRKINALKSMRHQLLNDDTNNISILIRVFLSFSSIIVVIHPGH